MKGPAPAQPPVRVSFPIWVRVVPYLLSAILFLSAVFAVFAPLPLLFLYFRSGRKWAAFAALTNCALVFVAGGAGSFAVYLVFVLALALPMAELLARKRSIEKTAIGALLAMMMTGAVTVAGFTGVLHQNPWNVVQQHISEGLDHIAKSVQEREGSAPWLGVPSEGGRMDEAELGEWKQNLLIELPSAVAVISLVLVWANLLILLRANPKGIRSQLGLDRHFYQNWKAPEFLVWPTLLAGFFLLVEVPRVTPVALNVFKVLMAIYAIQGLGILSFFFGLWKIRGFFRTLGFLFATFLMMPLLLSLGFFDLWFDFRSKFRQS